MKHLLATTALLAVMAITGCAETEIPPQFVSNGHGQAAVQKLADGSQLSLIYGGVRADPHNAHQRMDGGFVHDYWGPDGRLHSDLVDPHSTVSDSLALEAFRVFSTVAGDGLGGFVSGITIANGLERAAQIGATGNVAAAQANAQGSMALGQGLMANAAKPAAATNVSVSNPQPIVNVTNRIAGSTATASATGGIASATGGIANATSDSSALSSSVSKATSTSTATQYQAQQQVQCFTTRGAC